MGSERTSRLSKHIETRQHYIKEVCDKNVLKLQYCSTDNMVADVLTKPLGVIKQWKFAELMGLTLSGGNNG